MAALATDSPFGESNYSVRPRVSLNPFVRRNSTYDIASIPPMSSSRCTFSWDTGKLVRARDGAVLLTIAPSVAPGLFFDKTYTVSDAAGVPLGRLVPNAADWTMEDASSGRRVDVLRQHAAVAFARFDASTDGRELCRFTWTFQATVLSAEMEIEFKPDADPALRLLAVALAPILELRSRLISERQNTPDV